MTQYIQRSSEDTEQEVVIRWARMSEGRWPELALLHHIPNGGNRNVREAAKLKRMGVLAGVPDLHLPASRRGYHGLYIEMKYDGGRLQASQKAFMKLAAAFGNLCVVCYSADDAIKVLDDYLRNHEIENLIILKKGEVTGKVR